MSGIVLASGNNGISYNFGHVFAGGDGVISLRYWKQSARSPGAT